MTLRIAACHASPIFLSARQTTHKAIALIEQAAQQAAQLIVFPESFIPAFPYWSALRPPTANHAFFSQMAQESILANGPELTALRATAKKHNVVVSIGVSEKVSPAQSPATLYNSNFILGRGGEVLVHHRKLVPTFFEKLTWAEGDGYGLRVVDAAGARLGALICGENTNPLARFALMAQGEQIHVSTWPAVWPTRVPSSASSGATGTTTAAETENRKPNYDNVTANRTRAAAHCFEAKCFGVLCASVLGSDAVDALTAEPDARHLRPVLEQLQRGATMFLDPTGRPLPGCTVDARGEARATEFLQAQEDILYADVDVRECVEGKQYHDVVGGYQRLDVFDLRVDRTRREPVRFTERNGEED